MVECSTLIWLFPIIFIIHDFEEITMIEKRLHHNCHKLYERLPPKKANKVVKQFSMTTAQFAVAVLFIFLFVSLSTILANQYFINGVALTFYFSHQSHLFSLSMLLPILDN